ncbi:MAG: hypothetical protein WC314_00880 [Vulcanimicrobiota bacterium]
MKTFSQYVPSWFKLMLVASLAIVTYGMGNLQSETTEVAPQKSELLETLWLDRVPEMMHDSWNGYLFTTDNVGLNIQAASAFKLTLELYEFQLRKNDIRWHFPHDGTKATTKYTIEKLKKPTKHFDRQLTIENDPKNGGKTKVYFTGPDFANGATIDKLAPGALERIDQYRSAR